MSTNTLQSSQSSQSSMISGLMNSCGYDLLLFIAVDLLMVGGFSFSGNDPFRGPRYWHPRYNSTRTRGRWALARTYGEWLKEARTAKGWTQQRLANAAFMSRSHIAAIENGTRHPNEEDAKRLDHALGTGNVLETFRPGQQEDIYWFDKSRALEQQATRIHVFELSCVPGMLQTEEYATAVINSGYPHRSEDECHKAVVARLERAKLLEDPATPEFWALLDEAVIRRPIGGRTVMAAQLEHVVRLAESGRIRVNVVPFGTSHPLLDGLAKLMWFEDQPPVAYTEGLRIGKMHYSLAEVEEIRSAYDLVLGEAEPLRDSLAMLMTAAKGFRQHG
ncbi:helix-turn-helix transcriptional regulator [Streptomyces sp. NPDC004539]|uniref:helix-turn-helix domain-containing protein n=1 Tax=Streptomyces sp. NPDC004539 TaxID=3154280 RepID=UPI0033A25535